MYPFPEVCGHGLRAGSAAGKPPVSGQQCWLRLHARTCPHSALESSKDFCPLLPPSPQGLLPSSSSVPPGPSQQQRAGKLAREEGRQPGLTAFIPQPDFCCKCYFTCPTALRSTWQLPFRHRENPSLFLSLLDSKLEFKFCTQVFLTLQFSLIPSQDQRKKSEKHRERSLGQGSGDTPGHLTPSRALLQASTRLPARTHLPAGRGSRGHHCSAEPTCWESPKPCRR